MNRRKRKSAKPALLLGQLDLFAAPPQPDLRFRGNDRPQAKPNSEQKKPGLKKAAAITKSASSNAKPRAEPSPAPTKDEVELLDTRQAARRLKLGVSTLEKMRKDGRGPRFLKLTNAAIRYHPRDLEKWVQTRAGNASHD